VNSRTSRKARTRRRIIQVAAQLFLKQAADRVSIDEVMRECRQTRGAFYTYFPSKEALVGEACAAALDGAAEAWTALARDLPDDVAWGRRLETCLAGDLTPTHNPAGAIARLGADMARRRVPAQPRDLARLSTLIDRIGEESGAGRSRTIMGLAALVGAAALASQTGPDKALASDILNATREALLRLTGDGSDRTI
jgi:TetR/AcrR family transcriptional repressor of nem operon